MLPYYQLESVQSARLWRDGIYVQIASFPLCRAKLINPLIKETIIYSAPRIDRFRFGKTSGIIDLWMGCYTASFSPAHISPSTPLSYKPELSDEHIDALNTIAQTTLDAYQQALLPYTRPGLKVLLKKKTCPKWSSIASFAATIQLYIPYSSTFKPPCKITLLDIRISNIIPQIKTAMMQAKISPEKMMERLQIELFIKSL